MNDANAITDIGSQLFGGSQANYLDGIIRCIAVFEEELNTIQETDLYLRITQDSEV